MLKQSCIEMADDITDDKKCGFCKKVVDRLFRCEDCNGQQSGGDSFGKKLCKMCVIPHLQCDHTLTDGKGSKVLICSEHKMLQHEYCRTCDSPFCWGCMSKHSKHEFGPLDNRALEVRKKVFESLSEFEYEEKLMNAVKAEIAEKVEKHEEEQKSLCEKFMAEVEKLKQKGLKTIEDNCNIMKEHLKAVDDVVEIQQRLRDLLSVPNDHLVNEFREVDKKMKQLRIASDKMKKENAVILTCDVESIVAKVEQLHSSIAADLKSVLFVGCHFCCDRNGRYYRVTLRRGEFLVEDVTFDNSGSFSNTNCRTKLLNEITHCFSVQDTSNNLKVVFLMSNNSAYVFNPSDANMTLSSFPYPTKTHFLCPYYYSSQPYWSYWEGGVIKFTHNPSFTVQCESIPSVRTGQPDYYWLFFISSDNSVIVADIHNNRQTRFTIPDIERISCVSFNYNAVFIFSADGSYFYTVYYIQSLQFSSPVKQNWNNQSNVMTVSVNNYNYSITKAANPGDTQYPHLFNVKRV